MKMGKRGLKCAALPFALNHIHPNFFQPPSVTLLPPLYLLSPNELLSPLTPLTSTITSILRQSTAPSLSPSASISGSFIISRPLPHQALTYLLERIVRMAQPSSSHHEERRHRSDRERERSSSHHHRTISSTTLLLVLSLVLAVLAVMLSLPSNSSPTSDSSSGVLSYLTPKRTQALIARESAVAVREAEVARREAELLAGAPGGVVPSPSPILCPACVSTTVTVTDILPAQTIIKEVVKEDSLAPPNWAGARAEEILDRELKIAERERDISKREENVNRREHDASRREGWILQQLK